MLFSDRPRHHYRSTLAHEVICQLRFPTILSINTTEPADFQEAIRAEFPRYARRQESVPSTTAGGQPSSVANYHFLSADGQWKLNLTRDFISLSTLHYPGWEEFARQLDKPLAAFIQLYNPAYFQRVGLRYINILSRQKLGLEGTPWTELFAPAYVGPLLEDDVAEERVLGCRTELQMKLDSSCQVKLHCGPAKVKSPLPNAPQDPEVKFIFDMDLSMGGNISCSMAPGALETLHGHGTRVFEGAISDTLRGAMDQV